MKKSIIPAVVAGVLAMSLLSGCTLTERLGLQDNTTQGTTQDPATSDTASSNYFGLAYYSSEKVNPITSVSRINRLLVEGLYDSLFVLDGTFTPQPALCESYTGDGLSWTFTLKSGLTFWSGAAVTAQDVVYAYKLAMQTTTSPYYQRLQQIKSISAIDTNTVQITLQSANGQFIKLLDVPIFRKGTENEAFSDGCGPYMPQSDAATHWLVPFAKWYGGEVKTFPHISLVSTVRSDAVVYGFETGDISLTRADRISTSPATFKGAAEVYQTPTTDLHFLGVNCGRAPYQLPAVRQAISAAFDRAGLCTTQLQSFADAAVLPVNPQPSVTEQLQYSTAQDNEKALQLLATVGITDTNADGVLDYAAADGKRMPLTPVILVNSENTFKIAVTQKIIADLEQIGIRATMKSVPYEEYTQLLATNNYDLYYGETIMTADFDIRPLMQTGGWLNKGGYANSVTDQLIAQTRAATGDALVTAQQSLYQHLLQNMPIIPVAFIRGQVILRSGLITDFTSAPNNVFYAIKTWKAG